MKLIVKKGTASNIIYLFIQNSLKTDGSGLTGLVHNSAGLSAYYLRRDVPTNTVINLVSTTLGTYTSGGFKEVDSAAMPGIYEFDPPNACFLSGADSVVIFLKGATNMAPLPLEIQLDDPTSRQIHIPG